MTYLFYLLGFSSLILVVPEIILINFNWLSLENRERFEHFSQLTVASVIIALTGLFSIARAAHGSELALRPMECQVNTHSTPDAVGLSKVVTLVWSTFVQSRRHQIYDHEDCAKVISDWLRSQLHTPPSIWETNRQEGE